MSWVTIIMDPDDKKVKIDWFYVKKVVLAQSEEISLVLVPTIFLS